jgi:hypothetical protein
MREGSDNQTVCTQWGQGGFQRSSQHLLKVVLIHAKFDAPIEENGAPGLG